MDERLLDAFEDCFKAIEAGKSLQYCLDKYPDLAAELKPRLNTIIRTQETILAMQPGLKSQSASREKFLASAAAQPPEQLARPSVRAHWSHSQITVPVKQKANQSVFGNFLNWLLHPLANNAIRIMAVLIVIVLAGAGALNASAQSLPGSPFYEIKRKIENTQLALAPDSSSRVELQTEFSQRRTQELQFVTAQKLSVGVEFGGKLEKMAAGAWQVDHRGVIVPDGIPILGVPEEGLYVWVSGETRADGSLVAKEIRVVGKRIQGKVTAIQPDSWQIDQSKVFTSTDTHIEQGLRVGDQVEINVWVLTDGNWAAEDIRLIAHPRDDQHNQPTRLPEPGREDHAEPTQTLERKQAASTTALPTLKPSSTADAKGGPGPSPSNTPQSVRPSEKAPEPSRTSQPTHSPEPSKTPEPSRTLQPAQPPLQEVHIEGQLEAINAGSWVVSGQAFRVDASTLVEDSPKVGDTVEVRANPQADGSMLAYRIRKR